MEKYGGNRPAKRRSSALHRGVGRAAPPRQKPIRSPFGQLDAPGTSTTDRALGAGTEQRNVEKVGRARRRIQRGSVARQIPVGTPNRSQAVTDVISTQERGAAARRKVRVTQQAEHALHTQKPAPLVRTPPKPKEHHGGGLNPLTIASSALGSNKVLAALGPAAPVALTGRVIKNLGQATIESPGKVAQNTAKGLRDTLVGIPGGIVSGVQDPIGTAKRTVKDYERRYGPLVAGGSENEKKFRERIKNEGAAGELLDATGAAALGEATVGRIAMKGARKGNLKIATEARPRLRTSAGAGGAREQTLAPSLGKAAVQRVRDRRGVRRATREAGHGNTDLVAHEAFNRSEAIPSQRARRRAQKQGVAKRKGRAHLATRAEQHEQTRGLQQDVASVRLPKTVRTGVRRGRVALKDSALKAAIQHGWHTPEAARVGIPARIAHIERERVQAERARAAKGLAPAPHPRLDELHQLRLLEQHPEAFTPELAAAARSTKTRFEGVAAGDPELTSDAARARVVQPQAEVLGVTRGGTPIGEARKAQTVRVRQSARGVARARKVRLRATQRAGRAQGRAEVLAGQATRGTEKQIAAAERAVKIHDRAAANHDRRGDSDLRDSAIKRREAAEHRVAVLKGEISTKPRRTLGRLERERGNLQLAERREGKAINVARAEGQRARQLRAAQKAGVEVLNQEPVGSFEARTHTAAAERGAQPAGFYPSRPAPRERFSVRALGGLRAMAPDHRYRGVLHRQGREDASTTTLADGLNRNIKRKHNYAFVAGTIEHDVAPWSLGAHGRGMALGDLETFVRQNNINPDSLVVHAPGVFRETQLDHARAHEELGGTDSYGDPEAGDGGVHAALDGSTWPVGQVPQAYRRSELFVAYPAAVYKELEHQTQPSGLFGRALEIAKTKQARVMLGLSPAWLQFQVASNGLLSGLAGTGPVDMLRANLEWWRSLKPSMKKAVEPMLGAGPFQDAARQTHVGAASRNELVNAWRAFKASDGFHRPRRGPVVRVTGGRVGKAKSVAERNPLDTLFRIDHAQNNFFRRAVLYSQVKREAYRRLGGRFKAARDAQEPFLQAMAKGPVEMMNKIMEDPAALERAVQKVDDFLGDYTTRTAFERHWLDRNIIFYGFLRFSLKFAFYTMPVKHPIMSSIIGNLGRMQTDEVRRLLGGDELPYALGRFFWTKNGEVKSVDLSRANPALNTATSIKGPLNLVGLLPPATAELFDVAYGVNSYTGKQLKVGTDTKGKGAFDYTMGQRARFFIESMANLAAPYRTGERVTGTGAPEGDDSGLIFGRKYTGYAKGGNIDQSIKRDQARRPGSLTVRLANDLVPFIPRRDYSPEIASEIRDQRAQKAGKSSGPTPVPKARPAKSTGGIDWSKVGGGQLKQDTKGIDWSKVTG